MRTKKFGSGKDANQMLVRKLSREFFLKGRLTVTVARAKALRPSVEHMVHLAKKKTESAKNVLLTKTGDKKLVDVLTGQIAPVFAQKSSGFVRITRIGTRSSDGSLMGKLEWTMPVVVEDRVKIAKVKKDAEKKEAKAAAKKTASKKEIKKTPAKAVKAKK